MKYVTSQPTSAFSLVKSKAAWLRRERRDQIRSRVMLLFCKYQQNNQTKYADENSCAFSTYSGQHADLVRFRFKQTVTWCRLERPEAPCQARGRRVWCQEMFWHYRLITIVSGAATCISLAAFHPTL